ncbi:MAG: YdcF family protein [Xanthomonadales bacterium]|nr:YdcF family protein [Xanthomonadales bacterium]
MDRIDLRRLLTQLAMPLPVGLGLALLAGGLALCLGRHPRWRRRLQIVALAGLALLWLAAMPWTAHALMHGLESTYPPRPAAACGGATAPLDAIVVLGGAVAPQLAGDARARLHRGSDRVREAALLFHAGCAPRLLASAGGRIDWPAIASEADAIRALLMDLGVPEPALLIEAQSRTTAENAHYSAELLKRGDRPRILLVSSAWHLRRAVPLFERAGFEVLPVGSDYRSLSGCSGLSCLLPSSGALDTTGLAWKEYLGYWIQVQPGH